jgi:peptidyl-prolyl cis-trans isomerase D
MLDVIRTQKRLLIGIIVVPIAVVFVLWGISGRTSRLDRAATVNGEDISTRQVDLEVVELQKRYRQMFGGQLPEGLVKAEELRRQALDTLITRAVIRQEAERLGLLATDAELRDAIVSNSAFQRDGRFDPEVYRAALANAEGLRPDLRTPAAFEAAMREQLVAERIEQLVKGAVAVTDAEARQAYRAEKDKVSVEAVRVEARPDPKATFPENELQAYYEQRRREYERPASVTVRFVKLSPETLGSQVAVTEDEVRQAFEQRKDELATPARVSARHVLIKVDEKADEKTVEAARARAQAALDRVRRGEDFSKVALEVSEDPSKGNDPKRAGDLGWFGRGEMVKPFEDAAFALKPGETSGPVRTEFGWHVIRVDKKSEAKEATFAEQRPKLEQELRAEKVRRRAGEAADELAQKAAKSGDLAAEAKAAGLPVETAGPLTAEKPEGAKFGAPVIAAALRLSVNEVSAPVQDAGAWYVLQATQKTEASVAPLADVMSSVKSGLAKQKAAAAARERAAKVLEAAKASGSLAAAAKAAGLTAVTTGLFERRAAELPKLGRAPAVQEAAFKLTTAAPFPTEPIQVGDDAVVIRLVDRQAADPEADPDGLAQFSRALARDKADTAFEAYLAERRRAAEIWVNPALFPAS